MEDDGNKQDPYDITGKRFSHYYVARRIGAGGMGIVYEAEDERLQRKVALKVLPPWSRFDKSAVSRFRREALAASSLNHPNICTVYEFDEAGGRPFIAMELVDGPSLREMIDSGPIDSTRAIRILSEIAGGLEHAHARDIVHRDIKPGNVLLDGENHPKIVDFGLARISDASTITTAGVTVGTVAYMSPEQAAGDRVGSASDIWSLGVVYYEMLMGERPFRGEFASAVIYSIVNEEPIGMDDLRSRFGSETAAIIGRCLDREPIVRPSAGEIIQFAAQQSGAAVAHSTTSSTPFSARRKWSMATLALALLVLAVAASVTTVDRWLGPTFETSALAILPPVVADSLMRNTARGLLESSAREVSRMALAEGRVGEIAPYLDDAVMAAVESASDANRVLGIPFAIASEFTGDGALVVSLVDTKSLDTLNKEIVELASGDLERSRSRIVAGMLKILGLDPSLAVSPGNRAGLVSPGAVDYYTQGLGMLQQRTNPESVKGAIVLLERAIAETDDFSAAYAELGRAHYYRYEEIKDVQLLSKAERLCNRALELDPHNETVLITLGLINLEKGQYGLASREFDRALQEDSTNTEALLGKAEVFSRQRRVTEAETMFRQAISARPNYWPGYRRLALFYYFENRYVEAIAQFRSVAKLAPLNPLGHRGIGSSYYQLGDFERATQHWGNALAIADDYALYSNLSAVQFSLEDYSGAAASLEKALTLDSTDYLAWGNLMMAYQYLPGATIRFREVAFKTLELAEARLVVNPDDDFVKARLAGIHIQLDDTVSARGYLNEYRGDPGTELSGETVFEIATAWEALGRRDRALKWLEAALVRNYPQIELMRYPGLAKLREDPRFLDLIGSFPSDEDEPG